MSGWSRGDYHVIDAGDVQDGMAFLLDHLPSQLHVVIAGRADPALPLAGLRARGELAEIRAAELRFTPDEAAAYFNVSMAALSENACLAIATKSLWTSSIISTPRFPSTSTPIS